jgi:hypothetical protein
MKIISENLTFADLIKKISLCYEFRMFITVFTKDRQYLNML